MASISTQPNGGRILQFIGSDGLRRSVRLGKVSMKQAQAFKIKVEDLAAAAITGHAPGDETSRWVAGLDSPMHTKLAAVGLVKAREQSASHLLGTFVGAYIASRTDVKPRSIVNMQQAEKGLIRYFGESRRIDSITLGDADKYRLHLLGRGLAENTTRRLCGRARQFFRVAIRQGLIQSNPFSDVKCAVGSNKANQRFITRQDIAKVLHACPDAPWRLLVALSRYGGLRCPSEHLGLRWDDILWDRDRMIVRSPKTEHYEGKANREVPIFPELRPYLLEALELAEPQSVHVVDMKRDFGVNFRTQFERIIRKAGLIPWPRPFHNLRASRQTELAERFPMHVVCAWIGNSQAVAAKHYLQVTDDHFDQALQNAVQQGSAVNCKEMKTTPSERPETAVLQLLAGGCNPLPDKKVPPSGLEPETR